MCVCGVGGGVVAVGKGVEGVWVWEGCGRSLVVGVGELAGEYGGSFPSFPPSRLPSASAALI